MVATGLLGFVTPLALIVPLVLMGWGNGLDMPNAIANTLASVPANRVGAASALMGFVQMCHGDAAVRAAAGRLQDRK